MHLTKEASDKMYSRLGYNLDEATLLIWALYPQDKIPNIINNPSQMFYHFVRGLKLVASHTKGETKASFYDISLPLGKSSRSHILPSISYQKTFVINAYRLKQYIMEKTTYIS